jgi:ATP-dependent Clp protease ATP-binding subunit ClpA
MKNHKNSNNKRSRGDNSFDATNERKKIDLN